MKAVGVPAGGLSTELAFHHWNFSSQNDKLGHNSIWNQPWLMVDASKHPWDIKIKIFRNNCFNYLNYNKDKNNYSIQERTHYTISKPPLQRKKNYSLQLIKLIIEYDVFSLRINDLVFEQWFSLMMFNHADMQLLFCVLSNCLVQ